MLAKIYAHGHVLMSVRFGCERRARDVGARVCFVEEPFPDQLFEQHLASRAFYVPTDDRLARPSIAALAFRRIHTGHERQADQAAVAIRPRTEWSYRSLGVTAGT